MQNYGILARKPSTGKQKKKMYIFQGSGKNVSEVRYCLEMQNLTVINCLEH